MKKIILTAALLGSIYYAKAQVGIGTPTPASSAMLEVNSANKGVLIPRVALNSKTVFAPVTGDQVNSLLIYNTATVPSDDTVSPVIVGVTPGFYFWNTDKWERVTDESELTELLNTDIKKIVDLLSFAYPSNNMGTQPEVDHTKGGGLFYTPAQEATATEPAVEASFAFVAYNNTTTDTNGIVTDNYERIDITHIIKDLIKSTETKTKVISVNNVNYYLSETFDKFSDLAAVTPLSANPSAAEITAFEDAKQAVLNTAAAGTYFKIDVSQSETKTKIVSVKNVQYYLSETFDKFSELATITPLNANPTPAQITAFEDAIEDVLDSAAPGTYFKIDVVGGVINNIQEIFNTPTEIQVIDGTVTHNFTTVEEYVKYIVNNGTGSVGYTLDAIAADTTTGQLYIPANSLYHTLDDGIKVEINVAKQLITNTTLLTPTGGVPLTPEQVAQNTIIQNDINQIKTNLGDNFSVAATAVKTGDTWINGKPIFKTVLSSSVTPGTANLFNANTITGETAGFVTLPTGISNITVIGVKVIDYKGVTSSVTDLKVVGSNVFFRIGAGNMYTILVPGDIDSTSIGNIDPEKITVLVEYAGDESVSGGTTP